MKIEMGKKYQIITSAGLPYIRKFRRVLAVDVAGIHPVIVELEGGYTERFTYEGRALVLAGDYDETCEEVILIEVKEGEMSTIQQEWEDFKAAVMPKDAPPIQRQEMRRAFYAGARTMLSLHLDTCDLSKDEWITNMQGWHAECTQFAQDVKAGRA